jgi:protein involved in polysaccharide export with SLBB domain
MPIFFYIFFLSITFSFNINDNNQSDFYDTKNSFSKNNKSLSNNLKLNNQILDKFIDENEYIIGSGDVFLFNMITTNGVTTLELEVSPTGDILIPVVGKVNIKSKILADAYSIIIEKCKEKYEDAYVYINLIKLRQFKVLVTGNSEYSGMHIISSTNRVSDLIESIYSYTYTDTILSQHLFDFPKNIMIGKDIEIIRDDKVMVVNLFNFYIYGDDSLNPILLEEDIIVIKNSNKITVLGQVINPIRIDKNKGMTYREVLNMSGGITSNGDLDKIKFLNYSGISAYHNNEKNRISNIDPKYRSDTDESFLDARNRTLDGMIYISDNLKLENFLNSESTIGDIIIIPQKNNFVEILGGINNPGTYLFFENKTVSDYIQNAGGYTDDSKYIYVLDVNSGSRIKVGKYFIPESGSIIFIEQKIGYKKWDRIKDVISISASISSVLLVLNNVLGTN